MNGVHEYQREKLRYIGRTEYFVITTKARRIWKSLEFRNGVKLAVTKTQRSIVLSVVQTVMCEWFAQVLRIIVEMKNTAPLKRIVLRIKTKGHA